MIEVTRLNEKKIILNAELIESIESTPDTVLTLTTGKKFIVKEGCQEVKNLVLSYKRDIAVNWTANLENKSEGDIAPFFCCDRIAEEREEIEKRN